jgi:RNA polymerase-interacting CarD/CdnL/TRCF family regulator
MNFHKGDTVMHWTYGIGQIVDLEERSLEGSKTIYYVVQVRDMNDHDQMILKQSRNTLLGEWGFVLSMTPAQAEHELHRLLTPAVSA